MTLNPNQPVQPDREKYPGAPEEHQLPSLYPTAIPEEHQRDDTRFIRDRINAQSEKKSSFPLWARITAPLAAAAIGGGAYLAGKGGSEKSPLDDPTTPVATANPFPSHESSANTERVVEGLTIPSTILSPEFTAETSTVKLTNREMPRSTVENSQFFNLNPDQQQVVLQAKQATPEEFEKLPLNNRIFFQDFVIGSNYIKASTVANRIQTMNGQGDYLTPQKHDSSYKVKGPLETTVSDQMTANLTVLEDLNYADKSGNIVYDKPTAMKILPFIAKEGSPIYNRLVEGINQTEGFGTPFNGKGFNGQSPVIVAGLVDSTREKDVTVHGIKGTEVSATMLQFGVPIMDGAQASGLNFKVGEQPLTYDFLTTKRGEVRTNIVLLVQ